MDAFVYVNAKQMQPNNFNQALIDPQTLSHYHLMAKNYLNYFDSIP